MDKPSLTNNWATMLVTLVAVLCNGQLCLEKVVTNSEQSGITMAACASTAQIGIADGSPKVRIMSGRSIVTSASWVNTRPNAMCEITLKGTQHDPDPKGRVEPQSGDLFSLG
jgi:hypothetical protein